MFRIAPAESYDMIVQPRPEETYTVFAEAMDRSGYAAGTMPGMSMPPDAAPAKPKTDAMPGMAMPSDTAPAKPKADAMPGMTMPSDAAPAKSAAIQAKPHGPDRHHAERLLGRQPTAFHASVQK